METDRTAAVTSLGYFVGWLRALPEGGAAQLAGPRAKPWCEVLERLTREMRQDLRPVVLPLLDSVNRQADALPADQRSFAGKAARRILEFAWAPGHRDAALIRRAIEGVCRTFETAEAESVEILRRALGRDHIAAHGFDELPTLARELDRLLLVAPGFVEEVYRATLYFTELDDSPTPLGGHSAIIPLRSNRRQDYKLGEYHLGELFPKFMEASPVHATGAVIAAVEAEVVERMESRKGAVIEEIFHFRGFDARYAQDASHIWDSTRHRHKAHLQMLDGFEDGLVRLAGPDGDAAQLENALARVARENRFAAVWRRVLSAAVREPRGLGPRVWELATAVPVLLGGDTLELVGSYLHNAFPVLGVAEREAIEQAILSIRPAKHDEAEHLVLVQGRLIGCLPGAFLVTPEAKAMLQELAASGGPPPNTPLFQMGEATWEQFTEAEWLATEGIDVEAEPNIELRRLYEPVARFSSQFMNHAPAQEEAKAVLPSARDLRRALAEGGGGAAPRVVESGWTNLAGACAAIAGANWLDGDREIAGFVREVLLELARHDLPRPNAEREQQYEEHGALNPSPRWHAAEGLLDLLQVHGMADAEVLGAIHALSADPCVEVRSAVARHLVALYLKAPHTFWPLLRRVEAEESSRRTIHYALTGVTQLARRHPEELRGVAHKVFYRFRADTLAADVRCDCLNIIAAADARGPNPYGDELIGVVISDMAALTDDAVRLVQIAGEGLTIGLGERRDEGADRYRAASFAFLHGVAWAVQEWIVTLEGRLRGLPASQWPADARPQIEAAKRVAHELGIRTYFASGAFDEKMGRQGTRREKLTEEGRHAFLKEATPLLELLAQLGFPDVVHNVLETLIAYVDVDPRGVFLSVARAVRDGQTGGYHFEPLAINLIAGLVRRYIADYRSLFKDDADCRDALIETLDVFVRAGWPEAIDLTYRLEEVFR